MLFQATDNGVMMNKVENDYDMDCTDAGADDTKVGAIVLDIPCILKGVQSEVSVGRKEFACFARN